MQTHQHLFSPTNFGLPKGHLSCLAKGWYRRARIHAAQAFEHTHFDFKKPDFLEALLPFQHDDAYQNSPDELKSKCLATGFIIYNLKTIAIETDIITPACIDLLQQRIPSHLGEEEMVALSQTLIDEAYHTMLSVNVCQMASRYRKLHFTMPTFDLTKILAKHEAHKENLEFRLIRLAYATVSELFISDYLSQLSHQMTIQPAFQQAVYTHWKDELAHQKIFGAIIKNCIHDWSASQKLIFANAAKEAMELFASREINVWKKFLKQLYQKRHSLPVPQCFEKGGQADFSALSRLFEEIGLINAIKPQQQY